MEIHTVTAKSKVRKIFNVIKSRKIFLVPII